LYAFIRRQTKSVDEAQDLTQGFFERFLSKDFLGDVQPERGRFRSFMLAAARHYLSNERDRQRTIKRGGGITIQSLDWQQGEQRFLQEPADEMTAERLFERQWAVTLLSRVLDQLRSEQTTSAKQQCFEVLSQFLSADSKSIDHAAAAERLGMSEGAVRVATHRLRKRYRQLLRDEIAQTTASPDDVDDEIRHLFAALR
jgi:RNA polymerase sigma-70 factor (ECF subfamily)